MTLDTTLKPVTSTVSHHPPVTPFQDLFSNSASVNLSQSEIDRKNKALSSLDPSLMEYYRDLKTRLESEKLSVKVCLGGSGARYVLDDSTYYGDLDIVILVQSTNQASLQEIQKSIGYSIHCGRLKQKATPPFINIYLFRTNKLDTVFRIYGEGIDAKAPFLATVDSLLIDLYLDTVIALSSSNASVLADEMELNRALTALKNKILILHPMADKPLQRIVKYITLGFVLQDDQSIKNGFVEFKEHSVQRIYDYIFNHLAVHYPNESVRFLDFMNLIGLCLDFEGEDLLYPLFKTIQGKRFKGLPLKDISSCYDTFEGLLYLESKKSLNVLAFPLRNNQDPMPLYAIYSAGHYFYLRARRSLDEITKVLVERLLEKDYRNVFASCFSSDVLDLDIKCVVSSLLIDASPYFIEYIDTLGLFDFELVTALLNESIKTSHANLQPLLIFCLKIHLKQKVEIFTQLNILELNEEGRRALLSKPKLFKIVQTIIIGIFSKNPPSYTPQELIKLYEVYQKINPIFSLGDDLDFIRAEEIIYFQTTIRDFNIPPSLKKAIPNLIEQRFEDGIECLNSQLLSGLHVNHQSILILNFLSYIELMPSIEKRNLYFKKLQELVPFAFIMFQDLSGKLGLTDILNFYEGIFLYESFKEGSNSFKTTQEIGSLPKYVLDDNYIYLGRRPYKQVILYFFDTTFRNPEINNVVREARALKGECETTFPTTLSRSDIWCLTAIEQSKHFLRSGIKELLKYYRLNLHLNDSRFLKNQEILLHFNTVFNQDKGILKPLVDFSFKLLSGENLPLNTFIKCFRLNKAETRLLFQDDEVVALLKVTIPLYLKHIGDIQTIDELESLVPIIIDLQKNGLLTKPLHQSLSRHVILRTKKVFDSALDAIDRSIVSLDLVESIDPSASILLGKNLKPFFYASMIHALQNGDIEKGKFFVSRAKHVKLDLLETCDMTDSEGFMDAFLSALKANYPTKLDEFLDKMTKRGLFLSLVCKYKSADLSVRLKDNPFDLPGTIKFWKDHQDLFDTELKTHVHLSYVEELLKYAKYLKDEDRSLLVAKLCRLTDSISLSIEKVLLSDFTSFSIHQIPKLMSLKTSQSAFLAFCGLLIPLFKQDFDLLSSWLLKCRDFKVIEELSLKKALDKTDKIYGDHALKVLLSLCQALSQSKAMKHLELSLETVVNISSLFNLSDEMKLEIIHLIAVFKVKMDKIASSKNHSAINLALSIFKFNIHSETLLSSVEKLKEAQHLLELIEKLHTDSLLALDLLKRLFSICNEANLLKGAHIFGFNLAKAFIKYPKELSFFTNILDIVGGINPFKVYESGSWSDPKVSKRVLWDLVALNKDKLIQADVALKALLEISKIQETLNDQEAAFVLMTLSAILQGDLKETACEKWERSSKFYRLTHIAFEKFSSPSTSENAKILISILSDLFPYFVSKYNEKTNTVDNIKDCVGVISNLTSLTLIHLRSHFRVDGQIIPISKELMSELNVYVKLFGAFGEIHLDPKVTTHSNQSHLLNVLEVQRYMGILPLEFTKIFSSTACSKSIQAIRSRIDGKAPADLTDKDQEIIFNYILHLYFHFEKLVDLKIQSYNEDIATLLIDLIKLGASLPFKNQFYMVVMRHYFDFEKLGVFNGVSTLKKIERIYMFSSMGVCLEAIKPNANSLFQSLRITEEMILKDGDFIMNFNRLMIHHQVVFLILKHNAFVHGEISALQTYLASFGECCKRVMSLTDHIESNQHIYVTLCALIYLCMARINIDFEGMQTKAEIARDVVNLINVHQMKRNDAVHILFNNKNALIFRKEEVHQTYPKWIATQLERDFKRTSVVLRIDPALIQNLVNMIGPKMSSFGEIFDGLDNIMRELGPFEEILSRHDLLGKSIENLSLAWQSWDFD